MSIFPHIYGSILLPRITVNRRMNISGLQQKKIMENLAMPTPIPGSSENCGSAVVRRTEGSNSKYENMKDKKLVV